MTGRDDDGSLAARLARRIRPRQFRTVFGAIYLEDLPSILAGMALAFSAAFPLWVSLPLAALLWACSAAMRVPGLMKGDPGSEPDGGGAVFVFLPPSSAPADFAAALARGLPRLLSRSSRVDTPAAAAFKVLRLAELSRGKGLATQLNGGEAGRFFSGILAMRERLADRTSEGSLDSFEPAYRAKARAAAGRIRRLMWGSADVEARQYGDFLAGLAFEYAAQSGRPDDAWAFLRLVARGTSPETALAVLSERTL